MLLVNGLTTLFINSKPSVINSLRKLRNPPFRLAIFSISFFEWNASTL